MLAPISVCPVNNAVLSLSAVTDVSAGVIVPPTAPDISIMKILAPLAGAVLNVIDAPPLANPCRVFELLRHVILKAVPQNQLVNLN